MLTSFRGFKQFGVIGLVGMVLCWLSSYTLLPALLSVFQKGRPKAEVVTPPRRAILMGSLANTLSRYPRFLAALSAVLTVASLFTMAHARKDLLETNLEHLRSKKSTESGAAHYTEYLNEIFQRFLTPIVVMPSSRKNAIEIADRLKALKKAEGASSSIVSVQTIDDFIPKDQARKISLLNEIRAELPARIRGRMSPDDQHKVNEFLNPDSLHSFSYEDLPPLVREKFTEKDGSLGKLVAVEPPLSKDIWNGDNLTRFIAELRKVVDSVEPGAPVAGGMPITADLVTSISHDGPRATLLAFLAAVLLVALLFRDPRIIGLALLALFIGIAWFGGLIVALADLGVKINFLNFVALPITFGIGVDYGVNIFQRYRYQREGGITSVIRETGGAVGLCSLTTIIGYSSLLMASNRGFISFGVLAVLGEITCVTAALVALPAALVAFGSRQMPIR